MKRYSCGKQFMNIVGYRVHVQNVAKLHLYAIIKTVVLVNIKQLHTYLTKFLDKLGNIRNYL